MLVVGFSPGGTLRTEPNDAWTALEAGAEMFAPQNVRPVTFRRDGILPYRFSKNNEGGGNSPEAAIRL